MRTINAVIISAVILFSSCGKTKEPSRDLQSPQLGAEAVKAPAPTPSPAAGVVGNDPSNSDMVSLKKYNPVGDGVADDTAVIQKALDENLALFFPQPKVSYRVTSLQLRTGHHLVGEGQWIKTISGAGTGPVFKTGAKYPSTDPTGYPRRITINDMSVSNTKFPVLQLFYSPDFNIQRVEFKSTSTNTIEARQSVRGAINKSYIGQSGTGWAISLMDNANGAAISDNTISGGTGGNDIDLGQSQSVSITGNVMEVAKDYGIRVGGDSPVGGGLCSGITITGNYFEQVSRPIAIGEKFLVEGITVKTNYAGNYDASKISATDNITKDLIVKKYFVALGRVNNAEIANNTYGGSEKEPFVQFLYVNAPGSIPQTQNSKIHNNTVVKVLSDFAYSLSTSVADLGFPNVAQIARLFGLNEMQFGSRPSTGVSHVFTSDWLSPLTATSAAVFAPFTVNGGVVDSVEIVEKSGTVNCKVNIGSDTSATEILSFDPQSLVYKNGAATASAADASYILRPNNNGIFSVVPSTGGSTGSKFKLKITYRN